jgi:hypothetical protein
MALLLLRSQLRALNQRPYPNLRVCRGRENPKGCYKKVVNVYPRIESVDRPVGDDLQQSVAAS